MVDIKGCLLLLLLVTLVTGFDRRFDRPSAVLRHLQNLEDENLQEFDLTRRNNQQESDEDREETDSNHQLRANDAENEEEREEEEEEYLELRAIPGSSKSNNGPVITLQNRALMNTRLRVLYADENCNPFIAETSRIMFLQTKSVRLPSNAQNIKIIVQKDMFADNWRVVYNGTLTDSSQCIRVVGVTFFSKLRPCK